MNKSFLLVLGSVVTLGLSAGAGGFGLYSLWPAVKPVPATTLTALAVDFESTAEDSAPLVPNPTIPVKHETTYPSDISRLAKLPPLPASSSRRNSVAVSSLDEGSDSSANEPAKVDSEADRAVLEYLMANAGHPDDPQQPTGIVGVDDDTLAALDESEVSAIVESAIPVLERDGGAEHLFAIGRLCLHHAQSDEEVERALDYLAMAMEEGSAAAAGYLGTLLPDRAEQIAFLEQASAGGFHVFDDLLLDEPAVAAPHAVDFDPTLFNRPDLIAAFRSGEIAGLNDDLIAVARYVKAFSSTLADAWFIANDPQLKLLVDPAMSHKAEMLVFTAPGAAVRGQDLLMQTFKPLLDVARIDSVGGTADQKVAALFRGLHNTPQVQLDLLHQYAVQDAERMALMFATHPEDVRQIYQGMKKFVNQ